MTQYNDDLEVLRSGKCPDCGRTLSGSLKNGDQVCSNCDCSFNKEEFDGFVLRERGANEKMRAENPVGKYVPKPINIPGWPAVEEDDEYDNYPYPHPRTYKNPYDN